jgi:4-hydroxybenzoyl-CoA thioesterase
MKYIAHKQIRFHHCDPAGIVFYPQFFYLLHEVQEDFLTHIGFPEHEMIQSGAGVPIVDLKTEFLGMCRHGETVTISLELTRVGNASVGMLYEIHGPAPLTGAAPTLRLRANSVVVYSQVPAGKPMALPQALRGALLPYAKQPVEVHA